MTGVDAVHPLVVFVTRIGHLGEPSPQLLEAFRLTAERSRNAWTNQGVETTDDGEAGFVVLSWEHGCDVIGSLHDLVAKWPIEKLAVLIHPQGGPANWRSSVLSLRGRAVTVAETWARIWPDRIITCSTSHGRVGKVVRMLARSISRDDKAEFGSVLQRLRTAVASAMSQSDAPEERMNFANAALPEEFDDEETSITFVRHRLAGTFGALFIAFQAWADDPDAAGIRQFFGKGEALWNEITGLLVGEAPLSDWQLRTKTPAIVDLVAGNRREEVAKTLQKALDDARLLKSILFGLDKKKPAQVRHMLKDQQTIDALRHWTLELDRHLSALETYS